MKILANASDITSGQLHDLNEAQVAGTCRAFRIRKGVDCCPVHADPEAMIERILQAGFQGAASLNRLAKHTAEELTHQRLTASSEGSDRGNTRGG